MTAVDRLSRELDIVSPFVSGQWLEIGCVDTLSRPVAGSMARGNCHRPRAVIHVARAVVVDSPEDRGARRGFDQQVRLAAFRPAGSRLALAHAAPPEQPETKW
jgi:hypothetical protein